MKVFLTTIAIISALFSGTCQDTVSKKDWRVYPAKGVIEAPKSVATTQSIALNYAQMDGRVQIFQDARIESIGSQLRDKPFIYGYTIQLEVSQQKDVIKNARYKIMKIKPDVELDDPYESPNIYLYAGRFYDRASAYRFKNDISSHFPNAIVIGPRKLDLPTIKLPEPILPEIDSTIIDN